MFSWFGLVEPAVHTIYFSTVSGQVHDDCITLSLSELFLEALGRLSCEGCVLTGLRLLAVTLAVAPFDPAFGPPLAAAFVPGLAAIFVIGFDGLPAAFCRVGVLARVAISLGHGPGL